MGQLWVGTAAGSWQKGVPYVATASGYVPGKWVWRYNGSAWVQVWIRDDTPPTAPTVTATIVSGTKNVLRINVITGEGPLVRTVVKVSTTGWPSNPDVKDSAYYAQTSSSGEEWSEWWKGQTVSSVNGTKDLPASYQSFSFPLSSPVYISAWSQDDYFRWGPAGTFSINTLSADPPPPTPHFADSYFNVTDSKSWSKNHHWYSYYTLSNHYVQQGGEEACDGFWWYGGSINNAMSKNVGNCDMSVYIQRVNSAHGVSGAASLRIGAHQDNSAPANADGHLLGAGTYTTALNRGQGTWVTTTGWAPQFASGYLRGFGLGYDYTAWSSQYYVNAYGLGGGSGGQVYAWWYQF